MKADSWTSQKKILMYIMLGIIVLFSGFLRTYKVVEFPVSIYWDGAASAYNAYSILKTGRDEYGTFMPILFRSFDDYKMPGNIYASVPFIALTGLGGFSTTASTALFGTLSVLVTFFLVQELLLSTQFYKSKNTLLEKIIAKRKTIGLLTAFFLGISPWAIQFSRSEFEANGGTLFVILGATFLLKGIRLQKVKYFIFSGIFFAVSTYFYRSVILFTPLLIMLSVIFYRKQLSHQKKDIFITLLLFVVLASPIYKAITTSEGMIRSNQVSVFTNDEDQRIRLSLLNQKAGNTFVSRIMYNRRILDIEIIVKNYVSQFSPDFLFLRGDVNSGRHGPRDMGLLYVWEIPFIAIGIFFLFKFFPSPGKYFIISWILLSALPAAISVPNPHALRGLNLLPMPQLLSAIGIIVLYLFVKKWKTLFILSISCVVLVFFLAYLNNYYGHSAKVTSSEWGDGYKQLMTYVFPREKQYQKVIISGHYWKPYIYVLYYKKYDPAAYQKSGNQRGFANYLFGGTKWGKGEYELGGVDFKKWAGADKLLVALSPEEYITQKKNLHELTRIYNHNNELVFIVGETYDK